MNVQIINRVGWDGQIRAPDANELGWKESVRMNPLEDIYVALQPVKQKLPWPQPDMVRPLDVDRPLGTRTQFTGVDIFNNPINVTNQLFNFGQEYVWHCHLLGHEENDMLRMEVFVVAPEDPSALTAILRARPTLSADLSWYDNSMSAMSFRVERALDTAFTAPTVLSVLRPPKQPGPVTYTDRGPLAANTIYYYRVRAEKVLSSAAIPGATWPEASAWSAIATAAPAPIAQLVPLSSAFGNQTVPTQSGARKMTLSNVGTATMTIGLTSFTGLSAADFVVVSSTCGATLAVGAACDINIAFKPLSAGIKGAFLQVVTNSAINPTQTVALSGTGLAAQASVTPTSLVYSGQAINVRSLPKTLVVSNRGGATMQITSVVLIGNFARQNNGAGNCGGTLASGASCNLYVTFTPTAGGTRTGTLVISSNDPVNPTLTVALSGWGNFATAKAVSLTPINGVGTPGGSVTFTAVGSGAGNGAVYSYRFWFFDGSNWSLVQNYSASATWTWAIPLGQLPGAYSVQVDVRTNPTAMLDATSTVSYTVNPLPAATGVSLSAIPATQAAVGTSAVFSSLGSGAGVGAVYEYQYWLFDSVSWTLVQDWSLVGSFAWAIPIGQPTGAYTIEVRTRTSPWVAFDWSTQLSYTVIP
jgi:hypothetical protein